MIPSAFKVAAVLLAVASAFFWYVRNNDAAFVTAVVACVSFFLSVRFEVKQRREEREREERADKPEEE